MKNLHVFEIGQGRYALGHKGTQALAVVQRAIKPGRPVYTGVRGVRPIITGARVKGVSKALRAALMRIAEQRFN